MIDLRDRLRTFAAVRGWCRYHNPKNLSMALIVEAAELLEHFQWDSADESSALTPEKAQAVRDEVADVLIYLVELADVLDIDLIQAAHDKLAKNAVRYPVPDSL